MSAAVLAGNLLTSSSVQGQGVVWSTVSGSVRDATGQRVGRAVVTLRPLGATGSREVNADASGGFRFSLVSPGSYEVRAEALGFRPVLAGPLSVGSGAEQLVDLTIVAAPPPVTTVDTMVLGAGRSASWQPGGRFIGSAAFEPLPDRLGDLASLASLMSSADRVLGSEGLPGSTSIIVVDGVPFYRAPHPVALAESFSSPLFPRSALSGLAAWRGTSDIEWSGSAGTQLVASTSSSHAPSLSAGWSGDPLWSSSELGFSAPSLTSLWASARTGTQISPGAGIALGADALREETPLSPRVDDATLATLSGLDPLLLDRLSAPTTERVSSYSAFVRSDVQRGDASGMFFRGSVGYSRREFGGPGPVTLARDASPPEESVDYSLAAGYMRAYRPNLNLELRAGASGSSRTFDPASEGMPAAYLTTTGQSLGVLASGEGESSRSDLFLSPVVHYGIAGGILKVGLSGMVSSYTMSADVPFDLLFSDGPSLVAGQGFGRSLSAPRATFSTEQIGAFAQYAFEPVTRVRLTLGARYDDEGLPVSDVDANSAWALTTGLANDAFPSRLRQWSAHGAVTWDAADGGTRLLGGVSVQNGDVDPRVLHQTVAHDVGATATVFAGPGFVWPGGPMPAGATSLPTLTLLGPDVRAPRTLHASAGLVRSVSGGWSVHVEGAYRRTDFLMRRRNLNLPVVAQAADAFGRDVFGSLQQDGGMVTTTTSDARRFPAFHEVWALDPDGWSEYRGLTAATEYVAQNVRFSAAYTRSETTDNWVGASSGTFDAAVSPLLPAGDGWSEGPSDYDARHRAVATASYTLGFAVASAVYHFRSGLPFTPGYRAGVDANGDGSFRNDVAFVDATLVAPLLGDWACLDDQVGGFAERNSCRGPAEHSLDLRLSVGIGRLWGREAEIVLDGLDVIESSDGVLDGALLLVDPSASITTSSDGSTVTIPVTANPGFGRVLYPSSRGRMLRIGVRIG